MNKGHIVKFSTEIKKSKYVRKRLQADKTAKEGEKSRQLRPLFSPTTSMLFSSIFISKVKGINTLFQGKQSPFPSFIFSTADSPTLPFAVQGNNDLE